MTENYNVFFLHLIFKRKELEQKFARHRVPLVETHRNMYVLTPKSQGQNLTSGHVTPRSSGVSIGKIAYHSIRIGELNTIRPRARLYFISVRSYWQKTCHMFGTKNRTFQVKFRFARIYFFFLIIFWCFHNERDPIHKKLLQDKRIFDFRF